MSQRPPPRFYGVTTFRDKLGRFSFRYPTHWQHLELESKDGLRVVPPGNDLDTWFTASIEPLPEKVVAEDLDELKRGVEEGLAALPDCHVEESEEYPLGNLIKFERVFTFTENGVTRKRRFWVLYVDTWLIVLVWQGSTVEEYEYWLPMANYAYATFELPNSLWFATDRDLYGAGEPPTLASQSAINDPSISFP
jgi:hypothetical protein